MTAKTAMRSFSAWKLNDVNDTAWLRKQPWQNAKKLKRKPPNSSRSPPRTRARKPQASVKRMTSSRATMTTPNSLHRLSLQNHENLGRENKLFHPIRTMPRLRIHRRLTRSISRPVPRQSKQPRRIAKLAIRKELVPTPMDPLPGRSLYRGSGRRTRPMETLSWQATTPTTKAFQLVGRKRRLSAPLCDQQAKAIRLQTRARSDRRLIPRREQRPPKQALRQEVRQAMAAPAAKSPSSVGASWYR